MRKSWKRLLKMSLALALVLLTFVSSFAFNDVNAGNVYVPTTNVGSQALIIRGYSDNSTGGLRTAQTLEIIATGFASDAKLKYTFVSHSTSTPFDVVDAVGTSDIAVRLPVALTPYRPEVALIPYCEVKGNFFERLAITLYNAGVACANATIELTNVAIRIINLSIKGENYLKEQDNKRYRSSIETTSNVFRVQGSGASSPAVEIGVVDENPRSSTYQHSAKISYGGYSSANLSYDTNISYGIFVNESMSVEALLEQNGVAHVENCYSTTIEGSSISITGSSASVSGKTITAAGEPGESKFSYSISKSTYCTFHRSQSATVSSCLYAFRKPTITAVAGGFEITNVEAGVTYSIGNRSYLCYDDSDTIIFDHLATDWQYEIVLSKTTSDGKIAKKRIKATTLAPYVGYLNYERKPNVNGVNNLYVYNKGDKASQPAELLAPGFVLEGWYDEPDYITKHDFNTKVYADFNICGKWEGLKNSLNLTINANNGLLTDGVVELYQNGEKVHTLTELPDKPGTYYIKDAVVNGTYEVYINGISSKSSINVATTKTAKDISSELLNARLTGDTLNVSLNVKKLSVVTYVDGNKAPIDIGSIGLYNGQTIDSTVYAGEAFESYFDKNDTTNYDVCFDGTDTDITGGSDSAKNVGNNKLSTSLYFNTITANIVCDDAEWISDNICLRKANGAFVALLVNTSYDSITQTRKYTAVLLDDENDNPTEYYVYVDGINTGYTVTSTKTGKDATIYFDTANVALLLDGAGYDNAEIQFTNDRRCYSVIENENGMYKAHLLTDGEAYTYKVVGAIDSNTYDDYNAVLNFYTIKYKSYEQVDDVDQLIDYRTYIVAKDEVIVPAKDAYYPGLAFNCWNENEYVSTEGKQTSFNFEEGITASHTLYAHFKKPTVEVNGYVKCDESGAVSVVGTNFMMPNITINGFGEGRILKAIRAEFSGVMTIKMPESDQLALSCSKGDLPEVEDGYYTFVDDNSISITFNEYVTVNEAQNYLRSIIVKPKESSVVGVGFTTSDAPISVYTEPDWTYLQTTTGEIYQKITQGSTNGITLTTGNYYIANSVSFSRANGNGIVISGDVKIYIPGGVTLTATGANGSGQTAGKAAILLAENNSLTVLGGGSLVVQGGNAGNGSNGGGTTASNTYQGAYYDYPDFPRAPHGEGRYGGAGGGGAGAGIGTNGTNGGNGGAGGAQIGLWSAADVGSKIPGWGSVVNGAGDVYCGMNAGGAGGSTSIGANVGTLKVSQTITLSGNGGTSGSAGSGGTRPTAYGGYGWYIEDTYGNAKIAVTCGAGGGGGGGGQRAYLYGCGGAGGGGGGGGGSGRFEASTFGYYYGYAQGGKGGTGAVTGGAGWDNGHTYQANGYGRGGNGGTSGGAGTNISEDNYLLSSDPTYTVKFDSEEFGGELTTEYYSYFTGKNIVVPDCVTPTGLVFKGWVVVVAGSSLNDGTNPLTVTDTTKYQPGDIISLNNATSGDIILKPIYEAIIAKNAVGTLTIDDNIFVPDPVAATYYTYTINTPINGTNGDVGVITLKNGDTEYVLSSDGNGVYSLTLSEDVTFDIMFNGIDTQLDVTKNGDVDLQFASMEVTVCLDGEKTDKYNDIQLKGENSVIALSQKYADAALTGEYQITDLAARFEESYRIYVNNEDTLIDIEPGECKTVDYKTITVTLTGNAQPDQAVLRNGGKECEMTFDSATKKLSAVGLLSSIEYHLYINNMDTKVDGLAFCDGKQSPASPLAMNECVVRVYRNGVLFNDNQYYPIIDNEKMERIGVGVYKTMLFGEVGSVKVNGREFDSSTSPIIVNTYTATYDLNGGSGTLPNDSAIYFEHDNVVVSTINDIVKTDAQFVGWKFGSGSTVYETGETVNDITEQPVFTAVFKANADYDLFAKVGNETVYIMADELADYLASASEEDAVIITVQKSCSLGDITLDGNDSLIISDSLNNVTIASLTGYGNVNIGSSSTVNVTGSVKNLADENASLTDAKEFSVASGAVLNIGGDFISEKKLTNNGTINILNGTLANSSDETAIVENNGTINTKYLKNNGYFNNNNITKITRNDSSKNVNNGTITNNNGTIFDDETSNPGIGLTNKGIINNENGKLSISIYNEASVLGGEVINGQEIINANGALTDGLSGNEAAELEQAVQQQADVKQAIQNADEDKNVCYLILNGGTVDYAGLSYADTIVHNGGQSDKIPYTPIASADYSAAALPANAFELPTSISKAGYVFDGWYTISDYTSDAVTQIDVDTYGERVFYAKWKISNTQKAKASEFNTTADGYDITGKAYCRVNTAISNIEVSGFDTAIQNIFLNELSNLSTGTVDESTKTVTLPDVLVELKAETSIVCDNEARQAIKESVNENEKIVFVDITLKKYIGTETTGTVIDETDSPIETIIPYMTADILEPSGIVRCHNGVVEQLVNSDSHEDGTYYFEEIGEKTYAHIFSSKFSEFGVTYVTPSASFIASGYRGYYDGLEHQAGATVSNCDGATLTYSVDGGNTFSETVPSIKNAGKVDVIVKATKNGVTVGTQSYIMEVLAKPVKLASAPLSNNPTYDGTAHELIAAGAIEAANAANGHIEYRLENGQYSTEIPKANQAGTYTIYYRIVTNDCNYDGGEEMSMEVTVAQKEIKVSGIVATDKFYDGTNKAVLDCSNVIFEGCIGNDNQFLGVNVQGVYTDEKVENNKSITITSYVLTGAASRNYTVSTTQSQSLTSASILAKAVTVSITPNGGYYGSYIKAANAKINGLEANAKVTVTLTYSGTAFDGTSQVNGTTLPTEAGIYMVTASIDSDRYALTGTVTQQFVIKKQIVDVPVINGKVYDGTHYTAEVSDVSGLYSVSENNGGIDAGSYDVKLTLADNNNYRWSNIDAETADKDAPATTTVDFVIAKADNRWLIKPTVKSVIYGDEIVTDYESLFDNQQVAVFYRGINGTEYASAEKPTQAGKYRVDFNVTETNNFYKLDAETFFTIHQKEVILQWNAPADLVYDKKAKIPTAIVTNLNGEDQCDVRVQIESGDAVNTGTFTYKAIVLSNNNYKLPEMIVSPTYTVEPREITIEFGDMSPSYNGKSQQVKVTVIGLCEGDECTAILQGNEGTLPKQYHTVITGLSNNNYKLTSIDSYDWEIVKAIPQEPDVSSYYFIYNLKGEPVIRFNLTDTYLDGTAVEYELSENQQDVFNGVTLQPGKVYYIRAKGNENINPSEWVSFTAPERNMLAAAGHIGIICLLILLLIYLTYKKAKKEIKDKKQSFKEEAEKQTAESEKAVKE